MPEDIVNPNYLEIAMKYGPAALMVLMVAYFTIKIIKPLAGLTTYTVSLIKDATPTTMAVGAGFAGPLGASILHSRGYGVGGVFAAIIPAVILIGVSLSAIGDRRSGRPNSNQIRACFREIEAALGQLDLKNFENTKTHILSAKNYITECGKLKA